MNDELELTERASIDAGVLREMQQARERRYRTAVRFWWWVTAMLAGAVLIVIIARFFGQL